MNNKLAITFFAVAAFAVGCKPTPKVETSTKETNELAAAKKEYAYAQRTEYVTEKQKQLDEINREIETLSAKVEAASDAVKAEAKPKLQALREQATKLGQRIDELKAASEPTWESVKDGASKAYEDLKVGFNRARQWASEKIAP